MKFFRVCLLMAHQLEKKQNDRLEIWRKDLDSLELKISISKRNYHTNGGFELETQGQEHGDKLVDCYVFAKCQLD